MKSNRAGVDARMEAMAAVRFPNYSVKCVAHLCRGVAFYGGQVVADGGGGDGTAMRAAGGVVAAAALVGVAVCVVACERRGVAGGLRFEQHGRRVLRRVGWVPVWLLPVGRWGPDDARRRLGALRGAVVSGGERFAMLTSGVSVVCALVVGSVPGSVGGCVAQAVLQSVVLCCAVVCVVAWRPMRVPFGGWHSKRTTTASVGRSLRRMQQ